VSSSDRCEGLLCDALSLFQGEQIQGTMGMEAHAFSFSHRRRISGPVQQTHIHAKYDRSCGAGIARMARAWERRTNELTTSDVARSLLCVGGCQCSKRQHVRPCASRKECKKASEGLPYRRHLVPKLDLHPADPGVPSAGGRERAIRSRVRDPNKHRCET
jgi:hypothetical protein